MTTGCGVCADYLSRRARVLGPEIDLRAFIRGVRPEVVIREFMYGVHQRHLSGKPLTTGATDGGV